MAMESFAIGNANLATIALELNFSYNDFFAKRNISKLRTLSVGIDQIVNIPRSDVRALLTVILLLQRRSSY